MSNWYLYLLECEDGSLYAGISTDPDRRFAEHLSGKGARYTRAHKPTRLLAQKMFANRSEASKAESAIKKLPKSRKLASFETRDTDC